MSRYIGSKILKARSQACGRKTIVATGRGQFLDFSCFGFFDCEEYYEAHSNPQDYCEDEGVGFVETVKETS